MGTRILIDQIVCQPCSVPLPSQQLTKICSRASGSEEGFSEKRFRRKGKNERMICHVKLINPSVAVELELEKEIQFNRVPFNSALPHHVLSCTKMHKNAQGLTWLTHKLTLDRGCRVDAAAKVGLVIHRAGPARLEPKQAVSYHACLVPCCPPTC